MSNAVEQMRKAQAQQPGKAKAGTAQSSIAKSPTIGTLRDQLEAQGDQLEAQTREAVQQWREDTKARLRDAVAEELAIVAEDEDFFGFSGLFEDDPEEAPTIDVGAAVV
jgi:ATP-dependent protease HslVU (ClpYQ) peptidase subunit